MKKIKTRGLQALIPVKPKSDRAKSKAKRKKESIYYVEIKKIKLNQEQIAREKEIDKKATEELAKSIRKYGVIQPIALSKVERKKKRGISVFYRLLSGQKRLIAAKIAGLAVIPSVIKDE